MGEENFLILMDLEKQIKNLYGNVKISPCPFTEKEISELEKTGEILVCLPANLSMVELCKIFGIKANVDFENEKMIRNVMTKEDQWFITSTSKTPELIYKSAQFAERVYADESLHGMDFRRYLAFAGTFKNLFGDFPGQTYWAFLLSGGYDRSGVSIIGFDSNSVLSHHGWMKDFRAKFTGSRYAVLAPRIEITPETEKLSRAYRGSLSLESKEASID